MRNPLNVLSLLCLWNSPRTGKQIKSMSDSMKIKWSANEFTEKKLLYPWAEATAPTAAAAKTARIHPKRPRKGLYRKVSFTIVLPHSMESRGPSKEEGFLPHPGLTPGLPKVYRSK